MNFFEAEEEQNHNDSQQYINQCNFNQQEYEVEYQPCSISKTQKNSTRSLTKEMASLNLKSVSSKRISKIKVLLKCNKIYTHPLDQKLMLRAIRREAQYNPMTSDEVQVGYLSYTQD
ncbi:unnamed protein product (macronuclear) [Paramecium tetraurelia]|uniref:Uncharacterized protein n=1 Tax=Paramecium tetraurelia TaxID=5888 RepID=A0CSW9_PARTE|nr:uncharacterized protein GSPATT00010158001 [Paramecium tetraurelia]CAK73886.1 unnamed protein product [Paramecium tetraurelia]|eukprot:XP_001441283.1 hypothetical protein (macronuclear) [Paramecium tetraurelia strain d4-2]